MHCSRAESYIGVMIDDLTTRGVSEPYRMFTSRAEFRLSLRADNADQRLTPLAMSLGCAGEARIAAFREKSDGLTAAKKMLSSHDFTPKEATEAGIKVSHDGNRRSAFQLLSFPNVSFDDVIPLVPELKDIRPDVRRQVERDALYANYLDRQQRDIDVLRRDEAYRIPDDFAYQDLDGLSNELKSKLIAAKPETLAQAGRIDGMTPAALTLLLTRLKRHTGKKSA